MVAVTMATAVAGCSDKSDPSEKNFSAAINTLLAKGQLACLPEGNYPVDLTQADIARTGFPAIGKAMEALKNAGLLTASPIAAGQSDTAGAIERYQLSAEGLKYFHPIADDTPKLRSGELCYGHFSLGKVTRWDAPMKLGDYQGTTVYYTYRIDDMAAWATSVDIQAAFPVVRRTVNGVGTSESHWAVTLTSDGWKPNS